MVVERLCRQFVGMIYMVMLVSMIGVVSMVCYIHDKSNGCGESKATVWNFIK
jgi:hypothetical protein